MRGFELKLSAAQAVSRTGEGRPSLTLALLGVVLLVSAVGCRRKAPAPPPIIPVEGEEQIGLASWYGVPFHGRRAANGEIYDMDAPTAAHRTLPFETWVRVTNLENNRFTTVRITDRGPFIHGRIIDLSRAAAKAIDMIGSGTALVRLEIVEDPVAASDPALYAVQVGSFLVPDNARDLQKMLEREFQHVVIQTYEAPDGLYYRVLVGRSVTLDDAEALAERLLRQLDIVNALVVRLN